MKNHREHYAKHIGDFLTDYMEAVADPERKDVEFDYVAEEKVFSETFQLLNATLGEDAPW